MKRKYFLFRKEDLSLLSSSSSDTGKGLSVFGVSADLMSYITAVKGGVVLYFNNATPYEENSLTSGESFEKTTVTVNCDEGKEVDLIESIMNFLGSDNSPNIMRFDSVDQRSNMKEVKTSLSLGASVKSHPINRVTKEVSLQQDGDFTPSTSNTINDIDFVVSANLPILDLEAENATFNASSPFELTALANSGTGGATYDVDAASCVGTITKGTGIDGLSKDSLLMGFGSYAVLTNSLDVKEDYTLYIVYASTAAKQGPYYGSASGETVGFNATSDDVVKQMPNSNTFGVRHEGRTALPAYTSTKGYNYPVNETAGYDTSDPNYQTCYVFVVRRDESNNLFMYNHEGDVVAELPDLGIDPKLSDTGTVANDTTGHLVIDQIASAGGNTSTSFKGYLARFGVIPRDIGDQRCRNLATQLFNLYES